ncbi:hypothetical protein ACJMK2_031658 [Sinanodonta woodiana]|uniref:Uncharacterized protein n=1 Tax=Sinanodonta woodiana TaxID=1069815 RepID=A0ABD3X0V5_SINWO
MQAIAGNPFMLRTWSMIGSTLFLTIKKDNNTILDVSGGVGSDENYKVQNGMMMMMIYNQTIQELCLLFTNVSKEDEGIYEFRESLYRANKNSIESEDSTYDKKDGSWYLKLYVIEPDEIKQGYVGEKISIEFEKSAQHYTLYNYDKLGAFLDGSTGIVLTDSSLYDRLRIANDDSGRMSNITIENVSQRDGGLYKLYTEREENARFFFSIKDSPTCAFVGDNITIGWFYNQQGKQRTLRVIHPNQGVMMLLHQTNSPKIKSNFRNRLIYNGDILQSFMLFTLMSVTQSDAGLYTIETIHGNTIPGSKQLNVEVPVPINVILVTIGVFLTISLMMCYIILIRLHKARNVQAERNQVPAKCDTDLYITPIAPERPLLISDNEDIHTDHTPTYQNDHVNNSTNIVPMVSSPCMDGYEMIHMSNNDEYQTMLPNNDNYAESLESSITPSTFASDYLTVEFVMDSAV